MILPTKRINEDQALLAIGAQILHLLKDEPKTVSRLWDELKRTRDKNTISTPISYDWFVLALDFLYALKAIELHQGALRKAFH